MVRLRIFTCAILIAIALLRTHPSEALERHALVIANSNYEKGLERLLSSADDGKAIAEFLRNGAGYHHVEFKLDQRAADLREEWAKLLKRLDELNDDAIVLFYFSGHGVEIDGDSLLLPIDLSDRAVDALVLRDGLSMRQLFRQFRERQQKLSGNRVRVHGIFIIDACRASTGKREELKSANVEKPPAIPVAPPPGIFVFYAASAGQVAHTSLKETSDPGQPPGLSVYTDHLLELLRKREYSLHRVARLVRWQVHSEVAKKKPQRPQTPAYFDELTQGLTIRGDIVEDRHENVEQGMLDVPGGKYTVGSTILECEACPPVVVVPSGDFHIGSPTDELGRDRNEDSTVSSRDDARMEVKIGRPFAIGESEVTRGQFRAFLTDGGKPCPRGADACELQGSGKPVTGVSWEEAGRFLEWLNGKLGRDAKGAPDKRGYYRLPTEAEWEYAARAGATGRFVVSVLDADESKLCRYGNGADQSLGALAWVNSRCNDGRARDTAQVKSYRPNAFGLYDVHGNVWEWVADCWEEKHSAVKADGGANNGSERCARVARGGSWRSAPSAMRLAKRTSFAQDHRRPTLGFRVLRVLSDTEVKDALANR